MVKPCIALALAGSLAARAQAPITISGQLAGCADSSTVAVFEPIPGGRLSYFFAAEPNEALVRGGRFRYQLHHQPTGIVLLTGKCTPQVWAYVEPGAQVAFTKKTNPQGEAGYAFSGANSAANDLLANRQLLNNGSHDGDRVGSLLGTAPTAAAVLGKLQALLQPSLNQLNALDQRHQISGACHAYLRAETEQRLVFWTSGLLAAHFTDSAKANLHLTMNRTETRKLVSLLFARYDPNLPRYRFTTLGTAGTKANFMRRGLLPGPTPADHLWASFHRQFETVNSNVEMYDYAPWAVQEQEVGNTILCAVGLKTMSPADLAAVVAAYRQRFPASPYEAVLTRVVVQENLRAPTPPISQNLTFGYYAAGTKSLAFAPAPGLDTVRTLGGLVRSQRPGRAVFVDLWASWCGPCIAEFAHEPALHKFLADNNIDVIYVALDQPGFRDKWAALAAKYRLQGYHYLAPPALQKALAPTVPYIPRYLLFDKNGRQVEASAYRPSDGDKLYRQLRERLR